MKWTCAAFDALSPLELYRILGLRMAVFSVEQNCVYQDVDGVDPQAWHLGAWEGEQLLAYARLVPAGVCFPEPSIGRVVTAPEARRTGLGRELMKRALLEAEQLFGPLTLQIGAQSYLRRFYEGFGFAVHGEEYLEDGIPHLHMLRRAQ